MDIRYEKVTEKSFDEAVKSIKEELKKRTFGVLWEMNFKDKMEEHDIDFPNNFIVLEVCNPHKANDVLSKHLDMGYFLPCKMVVYEKDGTTRIGTARPNVLMKMAGYDDLDDVASQVEEILIASIDAAV